MNNKFYALCLGVAMVLPLSANAQAPQRQQKATPVIVSVVEKKTITDEVEALGTLRANESVDLTSTVTETVTLINFDDNQTVSQGDILVEMDAAEERAEMEEQRSLLDESQRQVNRLSPLVKQGAASKSALDESRQEVLGAKARMNAIQSRLDQRIIKAPYDGVLGLRNISVGALAQPGTLITTIDDISVMKLDFSVPELFLSTLKQGVEIVATTKAYPDEMFKGEISSVDSRIDPVTRSIQARAIIDNADGKLKPGLLMQVELKNSPREALVIPEEALIAEGSNQYVLVISENDKGTITTREKVEIGTRRFGEAEVLSGISDGAQVVTHGTLRVRPGTPVSITAVEKGDEPLGELLLQNDTPSNNKETKEPE